MLEVVADVHEQRSRIPQLLERRGVRVTIRRLPYGDYALGLGCVVERKTTVDLHLTVERGRFWPQIRRLRAGASRPVLLVEGVTPYAGRGGLSARSIRGLLLAVGDLGVTIVRSTDPADSAAWLHDIASRVRSGSPRDRPAYGQRPARSARLQPAEEALAAAPGVSVVTARELLRRFGSLAAITRTSSDELLAVPGV